MEKYRVKINDKVYEVEIEKMDEVQKETPTPAPAEKKTSSAGALKAPIQGTVLKVNVKEGQSVKTGDVVCVIEAMKLENDIVSDRDGVIDQVLVHERDVVDNNQDLITFRG